MKIAYIPAVSNSATIEVVSQITSMLVTISMFAMNIAWGLIFIKLIIALIKAIRNKSYEEFIKSLGTCFLGGLMLLFVKFFPPMCDAFFDKLGEVILK